MGFRLHAKWISGAYLDVKGVWLCLLKGTPRPSEDYSHIAFSISDTFFYKAKSQIEETAILQWKKNSSEGDSLYIKDPDGHKLEIHIGNLESRLKSLKLAPYEELEIYEVI